MNNLGLGVEMNDSDLWAKGFRSYEKVKAVDDMNDSRWAHGFRDCE